MTQRLALSQGARANASGKTFEDMLTPLFANYGFELMTYREFRDERGVMVHSGERIAVRNVPYQTIYGTPGRTEWVLYDPDGLGSVRIEVKTQQSAGSVDEKFPYMWLNAALAYPEPHVILLVQGNGFRAGALEWLHAREREQWLVPHDKDITVVDYGGFVVWFQHHVLP